MDTYKTQVNLRRPLPSWLILAISAGIVLHLGALVVLVTAAPSGPWPSPVGDSMILAPQFAGSLNGPVRRLYLEPLNLTHNYHFMTDRPDVPAVRFKVELKDDKGRLLETVEYPEKRTNQRVRHRQKMLAQNLGDDQAVFPPRSSVKIAAPGKTVKPVTVWEYEGEMPFKVKQMGEHLLPRDRPLSRPTEFSQILARSYMRYLCRKHDAASATLIRHSREAILPVHMFAESIPREVWEELQCDFGEYRVEK